MSPEDAFRRVLAARLPAGPGWTAWIDGTVHELAAAAPADPRLTEIRAFCDLAMTDQLGALTERAEAVAGFARTITRILDAPVEVP